MTRIVTVEELLTDSPSPPPAGTTATAEVGLCPEPVGTTTAEVGTEPGSLYAVEAANLSEAPPSPRRRSGRQPRAIDVSPFREVIEEFLRAAAMDTAYTVAICEAAVRITGKRASWTARHELRAADQAARSACVASNLTSCEVLNPCGTGACPFAPAEFKTLDARPEGPGLPARRNERPQPRRGPGNRYTVESALLELLAQREAAAPKGRSLNPYDSRSPGSSADKEDRREMMIRRRKEIEAEVERLSHNL